MGPLPEQKEGQYLTMTICDTTADPSERGHWSSPDHVRQMVAAAVAVERERCARICERVGAPVDTEEWERLDKETSTHQDGWESACTDCALSIRKREPRPTDSPPPP